MDGEVQEVPRTDELYPVELDEMDGQYRRERPEHERSHDAVTQRLALLVLGQPQNQDREHHRVVRAQQAFEDDEKADG